MAAFKASSTSPDVDPTLTLGAALDAAMGGRWRGRRCLATSSSQTRQAILSVVPLAHPALANAPLDNILGSVPVGSITRDHVKRAVGMWLTAKLAASTINTRVGGLSALGVDVTGCRTRMPRRNKWWLSPEAQQTLLATLRRTGHAEDALLADYTDWATATGFRVEETLRLTRAHFSVQQGPKGPVVLVTVPGLKTANAEATLPLTQDATAIFYKRLEGKTPDALLFDITYKRLAKLWREARIIIGVRGDSMATLKAFRRSAARGLTVNGMPTAMLQHYLRHENIKTTEGYLRLTGGYQAQEFARWL